MRRMRDRRPGGLFRGSELARLMTMVVMLGVVVLLFDRARDPGTWRWLAPDAPAEANASRQTSASEGGPAEVAAPEPAADGPTDRDPQELDAAREEFEAVTDKAPLGPEETPVYWRLLSWQQHESLAEMRRRAKKGVTFKQLWQQPDKWRGQLVEIPVHLRQTEKVDELADNALGLKSMYEVWGWTTDSQPYSYWFVCPQLPPGMPAGQSIYEEATFVGYFLKLLPYEDHEGVTRATPLLIGRLVWHPAAASPLARSDEWTWPWLVGGVLAVMFAVRWGVRWAAMRTKRRGKPAPATRVDEMAVAQWLDHADDPAKEEVAEHDEPAGGGRNGAG
jgi:hypothetical protein